MLRKATKEDIPRIAELYAMLFVEMARLQPFYWRSEAQQAELLTTAIENESWEVFVAEEDSSIAGFALVREETTPPYPCFVPHKYAYLMDMVVSPQYRGRGLGTQLIERVKMWAKERNLDYVELQVLEENTGAISLYERNRFSTAMRTMRWELG